MIPYATEMCIRDSEYMANVQAPSSEAGNTYKAYVEAGLLSASKTFVSPVYDNTDPGITGRNVYARGNGGKNIAYGTLVHVHKS